MSVRVEGDEAVVGITDFAQNELGDIVFVEVETEGDSIMSEEIVKQLKQFQIFSCL